MATKIYAQGNGSVIVPDGEKIAVYSDSPVTLYKEVGAPNHPILLELITVTTAGQQYVSSAFSGDTVVHIEASASPLYYSVDTNPSVTTPQPDITAADATFDINGLSAAQGGYVQIKGGPSSTSGNAGGAAKVTGGTPGATGVGGAVTIAAAAGGATSGAGGAVTITAGAGTNGNSNGGSIILTAGALHGSGHDGVLIERSVKLVKQGAPTAKTVDATLTAAEVLAGIVTVNQGAAGTSALQLPLASAMDTALPDAAAGDAFDFSVINTSTVDAEDASLTTNTGWTLVGSMDILAYSAAGTVSSGRFRARKTGTAAWTLYRLT